MRFSAGVTATRKSAKPYRDMNDKWYAHRGFLRVWKAMKDEIERKVVAILATNAEIDTIKCVGYSHGAALSLLATEDISLESLVGRLLVQQGMTIATAESCTGGRLAAVLNAQSGASAYYMGSVVAYDNSFKTNILGVSPFTLDVDGAVSESTVRQMAEGVRTLLHTDYAIATSGIAGPTGETPDKPVGTVWIAWASPDGKQAQCFHFGAAREREQITLRAVTEALVRLVKILQQKNHC